MRGAKERGAWYGGPTARPILRPRACRGSEPEYQGADSERPRRRRQARVASRRGVGRNGGARNSVLGHRETQLRYQPQTVASPDMAWQFGEYGSRKGWL